MKINDCSKDILSCKGVTMRKFVELIDILVASFPAVTLKMLWYRHLKNVTFKIILLRKFVFLMKKKKNIMVD